MRGFLSAPRCVRYLRLLSPVLLLAAAGTVQAQRAAIPSSRIAPRYDRQAFEPIDGMPDALIGAIEQTDDGFLWFGTRRGLVRFDGADYTVFTAGRERALPSDIINSLRAEPNGGLWISTERGLVHYRRGRFTRVDSTQIPAEATWHVLPDSTGRIWVASASGVRVGDGTRFRPVPGASSYTYALAFDARGQLWMAGREWLGTVIDSGRTGMVAMPLLRAESQGERFYDLISDRGDGMWIGSRRGAIHLDTRNAKAPVVVERVRTDSSGTDAPVWSLTLDAHQQLWLGTQTRGTLRWDGRQLHREEPAGASARAVWAIYEDHLRNVWVGTSGGLVVYRRSPFELVADGMDVPQTWSIRVDRDGDRWAATEDGRVYRLHAGRWLPVFNGTGNRNASSTWPSATGGVLIVSTDGRIRRATRTGLRDLTDSLGARGLPVVSLFEDTDRSVWLVTDQGLYHSVNGITRPAYRPFGLSADDKPHVLLRDQQGRLVIGRPGLRLVDRGVVTTIGSAQGLSDDDVQSLYDDGRNLWIGTADSGLFVRRDNRIVALGARHPALRGEIGGITADPQGYLWISTSHGLLRIARTALERTADDSTTRLVVRVFDRTDGLPSAEFNSDYQSQLSVDADGGLWFPNFAGAVRADPAAILADTISPQAHVVHVDVDGRRFVHPDTIVTTGHPGHVDVTFSVTDARVPGRARASYRILGLDRDWQELGTRRLIAFGPLRAGSYTVEIRVANDQEPWASRTALVTVRVPRLWYEQPWFFLLLTGSGAGLIAAFVRWRVRQIRRRAAELEQLVAARTAELESERELLEVRVAQRTHELSQELETRTQLERRLAAAHELETVGRLAGGVAHEINNALTTVLGFTEMAQVDAPPGSDLATALQEVLRAGRRAADITRQLLAFARRQQITLNPLQLDQLVQELLPSLQQIVRRNIVIYATAVSGLPAILADRSQIEQLIVNLVRNAQDAMPKGGTLTLHVDATTLETARLIGGQTLPPGPYLILAVTDTGEGIPADVLPRLFEPFFTTKEMHEGSGLGLPVCQGIVTRHHGAIDVETAVGVGTTMRIWIPAASAESTVAIAVPNNFQGTERILVVEDEAAIRRILVRTLTHLGYQVQDAEDGAAALRRLQDPANAVDLIVTDVQMPQMTGLELGRAVRRFAQPIPMVFMSGYAGLDDQDLDALATMGPLVPKPFTQDLLLQVIRAQLDARRTPPQHSPGSAQ